MITNYTELKEAIADWLNRSDLDSVIPEFIANAEARLNKRVRHRDMEESATVNLDANGEASLPDDYVEWRLLIVDTTPKSRPEFVEPDSREFMYRFRPYSTPQYFTILSDKIKVQPAANTSATLYFYKKVPALTVGVPTNWLLTRSPEAYLYASLVEAATYLRDNEALTTYAALFEESVNELLNDGRRRRMSREPAPPQAPAGKTQEQMQ